MHYNKVYILVKSYMCLVRKMQFQKIKYTALREAEELIKQNPGMEPEKVIAKLIYKFGLSKSKAQEYIKTLILADVVEEKEGGLYARSN